MNSINAPGGGYSVGGYHELAVPPALRGVAEVAWVFAAARHTPDSPLHRIIPETGVSLYFESRRDRDGRVEHARLMLMGPIRTVRFYRAPVRAHMEAIRLKAEWAGPLLGIDAAGLADEMADATRACEARARAMYRLRDALVRTRSPVAAVRLLCDAVGVLAHVHPPSRSTLLAGSVLDAIRSRPRTPLDARAQAVAAGTSERHVRRVVSETTGAGPKYFHRVRRLHCAIAAGDTTESANWARVAAAAGYFDQGHLINECRTLTGLTPVRLAAERAAMPAA